MEEWKRITLQEVTDIIGDGLHGTPVFDASGEYFFVNGNNLVNGVIAVKSDTKKTSVAEFEKYKKNLTSRTLFVSINGTIGNTARYRGERIVLGKSTCYLNVKPEYDLDYIYYILCSEDFQNCIKGLATGTTIKNVSLKTIREYTFYIPSLEMQRRIGHFLRSIDDKISLNNCINHNLVEQAQALYKSWFVDFEPFKDGEFVNSELGIIPKGWSVVRAENVCPINIGKTPPRKESKWFSTNIEDCTWVSISDMSNCGVFIENSSETLTRDAVCKFNIALVPAGSVLLSFKLTIGRVAIADKELTTNEAIARFVTNSPVLTNYLYLALYNYDYSKLGSTSSIATAVNSKIIKAMPLLYPDKDVINEFANIVGVLFEEIKKRQKENIILAKIRDSALPRLMSGDSLHYLTC